MLPAARERDESPRAKRSNTSAAARRDARPVVGHGQHARRRRRRCERGGHRGAGRGVHAGVGEQVREHLVQPRVVAVHVDRARRQVQPPVVVGAGGLRVADRVDDERRTGRRRSRSSGRPSSSRASSSRSSTSVVIRAHSDSIRPQRVRHVGRHLVATAPGQLGVPADRGERGAQLVARVGDELADPRLAGLAGGERAGDVAEHAVERGADLAHLGARVGVGVRHPFRERDLTAVERQLGDPAGGGGDPAERAQRAPDQVRRRRARRAAGRRRRSRPRGRPVVAQRLLDVGQRQAGDRRTSPPGVRSRDDPVVAERAEVDGVRLACRRAARPARRRGPRARPSASRRPVQGAGVVTVPSSTRALSVPSRWPGTGCRPAAVGVAAAPPGPPGSSSCPAAARPPAGPAGPWRRRRSR